MQYDSITPICFPGHFIMSTAPFLRRFYKAVRLCRQYQSTAVPEYLGMRVGGGIFGWRLSLMGHALQRVFHVYLSVEWSGFSASPRNAPRTHNFLIPSRIPCPGAFALAMDG
jgi:hypothetical protein